MRFAAADVDLAELTARERDVLQRARTTQLTNLADIVVEQRDFCRGSTLDRVWPPLRLFSWLPAPSGGLPYRV